MRRSMMSKKMHVFVMALLGIFICMISFFLSFYSATREMRRNMEQAQNSASSDEEGEIYRFKTEELLKANFEEYGKNMGFSSAAEYEQAASDVINNPDALHKTDTNDGFEDFYIVNTNEFVEVTTDGYIREYFKPDAGKLYFDSQ